MDEALKSVARCTACGREYVWISEQSDMTDHYGIRDPADPKRYVQCFGKIEMIAEGAQEKQR